MFSRKWNAALFVSLIGLVFGSCTKISRTRDSQALSLLASSAFNPGRVIRPQIGKGGDGGLIGSHSGTTTPDSGSVGSGTGTNGTAEATGSSSSASGDGGTIGSGGSGGTGDGGTTGCGGLTMTQLSRLCTWHGIPNMFFEEASRPILTIESIDAPSLPQLAAFGPSLPQAPSRLRVAKLELSGLDLMAHRFSTTLGLSYTELRADFPSQWALEVLQARVCNDPLGTGMCGDKSIDQQISPQPVSFFAGQIPQTLDVTVYSGKFTQFDRDYYTHMPSFCDKLKSPLVLDLDNEGFLLTSAEEGVYFDLGAEGMLHLTGWTAGEHRNAFLVRDIDANGVITSGAELFGNATHLKDGTLAANGFLALAELDENRDHSITPQDSGWKTLKLWIDKNHDGLSQPSELFTLEQFGIKSISTDYVDVSEIDNFGNQTRQRSVFYRDIAGAERPGLIIDVWFNSPVDD